MSRDARDGRLIFRTFGLDGLRDRFRVLRRTEVSSDTEGKCFELMVGTGGASVGDCVDRPYLEVFRRTTLGGERFPVGVDTGEARWNSASSALERTLLNGCLVEGVSFGGDGSRLLIANSIGS
jgi:hypothetical protein